MHLRLREPGAAATATPWKVFRSLAGHGYKSINIVGGGCRDGHLNRRTAEVCGLPVYAGPVEGTALGNLAVQMLADGVFPHLKAVRAAIAESFDVQKVEP